MTLVYEVLQLEQEIEDKLSYHFLDENIMIDKINKSKLKSLTFVMRQSNFPKHIQDKYIIAITLVEIASEIHEQIKENGNVKKINEILKYFKLFFLLLNVTFSLLLHQSIKMLCQFQSHL